MAILTTGLLNGVVLMHELVMVCMKIRKIVYFHQPSRLMRRLMSNELQVVNHGTVIESSILHKLIFYGSNTQIQTYLMYE